MARAVEKAFADKRHLIVEAGTGTGKTLAYLLPALRLARERQQRVIISTGTKNLQEQLYFKDIPFLESLLGPLKVCYMKGRGNYLCKHKLYALRASPLLTGLEEISQFHSISEWEKTTGKPATAPSCTISQRAQLLGQTQTRALKPASAKPAPTGENCFITAMRRKALEIATSSSSTTISSSLTSASNSRRPTPPTPASSPEAAVVIFDESPRAFEDVRLQLLRHRPLHPAHRRASPRDIESMLKARDSLSSSIISACATLKDRSRLFFAALPGEDPFLPPTTGRMPFEQRESFLGKNPATPTSARSTPLTRLEGELDELKNVEESTTGLRKRTADIKNHLKFLLESTDPNTVFWIERRPRRRRPQLEKRAIPPRTLLTNPPPRADHFNNLSSRPDPLYKSIIETGPL